MNEMADFLNSLPRRKKPERKPKPTYQYDVKQRYFDAHRVNFERQYPHATRSELYFLPDIPDISTTNGGQKYITDVMKWLGHWAERVNSMGIPMRNHDGSPVIDHKTGKQKYRKPGSTTGSADIHGHLNFTGVPIAFKIEYKRGADSMRDAQIEYRERIMSTGGIYVICKTVDDFWFNYDFWEKKYKV